ncbi:hypothetical protein NXX09_20585 [Bacteroides uniformis]|nr:hypothetical protein [Bacteroides uniformis]
MWPTREDGGDYQLEFDYPSYELLQPFGGGTAPLRAADGLLQWRRIIDSGNLLF